MNTRQTVVCIRGSSGSGKTTLAEALVPLLHASGLRSAFLKRSHHLLDTAGKDSDRLACAGTDAVLLHDASGAALFRQPDARLSSLLALLPSDLDLALVETFRPERFPVILTDPLDPGEGETLLLRAGRAPFTEGVLAAAVERILGLQRARAATAPPDGHGHAHRCPGALLGRRLAAYAAALLAIEIPRHDHRLRVVAENDGCAADGIALATGCLPGNRTLRFRYVGKLAATFTDTDTSRAVRVAALGDCRERAARLYPDTDRHLAQLLAYERLSDQELFDARPVGAEPLPEGRRAHLRCAACTEEVDSDATVAVSGRVYCRPCARAAGPARSPFD